MNNQIFRGALGISSLATFCSCGLLFPLPFIVGTWWLIWWIQNRKRIFDLVSQPIHPENPNQPNQPNQPKKEDQMSSQPGPSNADAADWNVIEVEW